MIRSLSLFCSIGILSFFSQHSFASDRAEPIFKQLCAACHGAAGEGKQELAAPAIAGMAAWYVESQVNKFRNDMRGNHPDDLPGMRMRPMARTLKLDSDVKEVAEYVSKLKAVPSKPTITGNALKGEEQFQVCAACHGADAKGNQALNAPSLVGSNDWYLMTQLKNFKAKIRGGNPAKDPVAAGMQPMAAMLDDEGMRNVIAYINALSKSAE